MELNTVLAVIAVVLIIVVFFAIRNRKDAHKMMENNKGVVPLMLQKSTQIKVARLQEATQGNTPANTQLVKLVSAYKNNLIKY
jgi:hypothetical protein